MANAKTWWAGQDGSSKYNSFKEYVSCYESHPALNIGDTGLVIYGGSCSRPVVKDADVYIGFDGSMTFTSRALPWNPGTEFLYLITDMSAPKESTDFKRLVSWTAEQLQSGAKVHCGCIGGHGRTGMFLSALVSHMTGEQDAITYVRQHYCKKAVESHEQAAYLEKHFGILPVAGAKTKSIVSPPKLASYGEVTEFGYSEPSYSSKKGHKSITAPCVEDSHSIWGRRCI